MPPERDAARFGVTQRTGFSFRPVVVSICCFMAPCEWHACRSAFVWCVTEPENAQPASDLLFRGADSKRAMPGDASEGAYLQKGRNPSRRKQGTAAVFAAGRTAMRNFPTRRRHDLNFVVGSADRCGKDKGSTWVVVMVMAQVV
jgi:hypothetical protein